MSLVTVQVTLMIVYISTGTVHNTWDSLSYSVVNLSYSSDGPSQYRDSLSYSIISTGYSSNRPQVTLMRVQVTFSTVHVTSESPYYSVLSPSHSGHSLSYFTDSRIHSGVF